MIQNSNSNTKLIQSFCGIFIFLIHSKKSDYSQKYHCYSFFENGYFTLISSSSSNIYNIVIDIDTPTSMKNQFEVFNAHKINLHFFYLTYYELKTTCVSLSLLIHPKT